MHCNINNYLYLLECCSDTKLKTHLEDELKSLYAALEDAASHGGKERKMVDRSELSRIDSELLTWLSSALNKIVKEMPGDGGCLFWALGDQLGLGEGGHLLLRAMVCDYMAANKDRFRPFITGDIDAHIDQMRLSHTYADHPEIMAASEVLNVKIIIYERANDDSPTEIFHPDVATVGRELFICRRFDDHYDSVWSRRSRPRRHGKNETMCCIPFSSLGYTLANITFEITPLIVSCCYGCYVI